MNVTIADQKEIERQTVQYEQGGMKLAVGPVLCYDTKHQPIGYIPVVYGTLLSGHFLPIVVAVHDWQDYFQWTRADFERRGLDTAADAMRIWRDANPSPLMEKVIVANGVTDMIKSNAIIRTLKPVIVTEPAPDDIPA